MAVPVLYMFVYILVYVCTCVCKYMCMCVYVCALDMGAAPPPAAPPSPCLGPCGVVLPEVDHQVGHVVLGEAGSNSSTPEEGQDLCGVGQGQVPGAGTAGCCCISRAGHKHTRCVLWCWSRHLRYVLCCAVLCMCMMWLSVGVA